MTRSERASEPRTDLVADRGGVGTAAGPPLDPESVAWVAGLGAEGPVHDLAVVRLHDLMVKMARVEASRRSGWHGITGPELDDLADQAADDAVMSILRKVEGFRGDSRFTTWACAFAIHEVANKFARHAWRHAGVALDAEAWDRLPARLGRDPEAVAESHELVDALRTAVQSELTPHQRRVFVALVVDGVALDVLALELESNRNAIYKTMFDARRKVRAHLVTHGYLTERANDDGR